jgi:hypothetical protein
MLCSWLTLAAAKWGATMVENERSAQPARNGSRHFGRGALLALAMSMSVLAIWSAAVGQTPAGPEYDAEGKLKFPFGFHKWVFVGSNIGLQYKKEQHRTEEAFHNVYINPAAFEHFVTSTANPKVFPDKTILVMDVYEPKTRDDNGVLSAGKFNGPRSVIEVAVKNAARPGNVPQDWAYYAFQVEREQVVTEPVAAIRSPRCYACHKENAQTDNVWVQFYPPLRDKQPEPPR